MADSALLDLPQFLDDGAALADPIDLPFDFPPDLADFDFDFVNDFFDFPDSPCDSPAEMNHSDTPCSEGSDSREACGSASGASGSPDPTTSPPSECRIYGAESPESRNSATELREVGKSRNLKRKKGRDDGDRNVVSDGASGDPRSSKFRRPGTSDEANSSCFLTTGNDGEEKRRLRLMRNRESAHLSRQRRKQYVEELQEKVKSMHSTISDLNGKIAFIMAENVRLRQQLGANGAKGGAPAAVYPGMPPMVPMHFPWVPYAGYPTRPAGSQVPLVPIPKLKQHQPVPAAKVKKSEGKKTENRSKKVASVSLLGLLFFSLIVGAIVSGGDFRYGDLFTGEGRSRITGQARGRVLSVRGNVEQLDQSAENGHLNGGHLHDKRLRRHTDGRIEGDAHAIHSSPEPSISGNSSEPLFASLYVPRNDKLVKIDGNLIISSVLAGESAKIQTSSGVKGYPASGREGQESDMAIPRSVSSALAVVNSGRHSHMYRAADESRKALPAGSTDVHAHKWNSASPDSLPQDWFHEGLEGPIFSSGICTEVFRFDALEQQAGIVPASSVANATKNITKESCFSGGKLRNRRVLYTHPIPLGGSTPNGPEEVTGIHPGNDKKANDTSGSNSIVVSLLVDPREVGDRDSEGMIMPKSLSKIFVVVLVDGVKYITYSCVLPFKSNMPHLVTR